MKVLHVIPSMAPARGGPSTAMPLIEQALIAEGIEVETATTDDDGEGRRMAMPARVLVDGVVRHHFRKQANFYTFSGPFRGWIRRHVADFDLVHVHAVFSHPSVEAAFAARRAGIPYIVRPCGVLTRYGMATKAGLKRLSVALVERRILRDAAGIHCTSTREAEELEALGLPLRPFVLPLGIRPPAAGSRDRFLARHPHLRDHLRLLFLSRLDKKKNLESVIDALALLGGLPQSPVLIVCGAGDESYTASLRRRAEARGVADRILWAGFVEGADKADALAAADVFVLPSFSENFGIAVVEAMFAGLPCVISAGVGIAEDLAAGGGALVVPPTAEGVAEGVRGLAPELVRREAGLRARVTAGAEYSVEAMGRRLREVYERLSAMKTSA